MMNKLLNKVNVLADEELKMANEQYPLFASDHEGAAVLLEEIEEAEDELKKIKSTYETLWMFVKDNTYLRDKYIFSNTGNPIDNIKCEAIHCAAECIQVAAMCEKMKMSEDSRKEN